jgi:hypothetical protein
MTWGPSAKIDIGADFSDLANVFALSAIYSF